MSGHPATHAHQILIPTELWKRTYEEIWEEKEAKEKKEKLAAEKAGKQKGREQAQAWVAAFEDKQVSVAKTRHSLRPDLENDNLPKPPRQSSQ